MRHLGFIAALVILALAASPVRAQQLRVFVIDVDQGAATLFVAPTGESLLIDSGPDGAGTRLRTVLHTAGVTRIDHLITTHYHADHYGGIDELTTAPAIPIGEAHDRGDKDRLPPGADTLPRFVEYQNAIGHRAVHMQRGDVILLGEVTVRCISSGGVVLGEVNHTAGHDENDMSVSVLVEWREFRMWVGGDVESFTEQKIADLDAVLDVDVYQANHHGSHTSTSQDFISDLAPAVAVISNGNHAGHKHPRQVTLNTLAALPSAPVVYQTNRYLGGGLGGNTADTLIADLNPAGPEGTILISVDAATRRYTVNYGTRSHSYAVRSQPPAVAPSVIIASLLPNPVGDDRELEEVTIRNMGAAPVDLTGWVLRDTAPHAWPITELGVLAAGVSATTVRHGRPLGLNNGGDAVQLIDPLGQVRDTFTYGSTPAGVRVTAGG